MGRASGLPARKPARMSAPSPQPSTRYPVPGTSLDGLLTAEEFHLRGDSHPSELVGGIEVRRTFPGFRHGEICGCLSHLIGGFVRASHVGRALHTGVFVRRNPDTVRAPDLSYFSYERLPKCQSPFGYAGASPEIAFEVVSPTNTRREITTKIGEYLNADVNVVCVVDPQYQTVNLHFADLPAEKLTGDQPLTFADLPSFGLPVRKLFE